MVNVANMMKQAQVMQKKMLEAQEKLAEKEYTGSAGGGLVAVTMNGKGEVLKVKLTRDIVNPDEVEILEDLMLAAINDVKKKQGEDSEDNYSNLLGGFNLPAGFKFPF